MSVKAFPWRSATALAIGISVLSGLIFILYFDNPTPHISGWSSSSGANGGFVAGATKENNADSTALISGITCAVSTISSFFGLWLSWRVDKRQARESEIKFAQLEAQLKEARAKIKSE